MKTKHERHWKRLLVGAACAAAALAVAGCASAPQAASSSEYQPDKPLPVEIHEPFEEFLRDTKDVFRARASARGEAFARGKAGAADGLREVRRSRGAGSEVKGRRRGEPRGAGVFFFGRRGFPGPPIFA